jgi:hypothetical protein
MNDDELERAQEDFAEGYLQGVSGSPGSLNILSTADGPIEGRRTGDIITWDLPDGRTVETHLLSEGNFDVFVDGKLEARVTDDPDDDAA